METALTAVVFGLLLSPVFVDYRGLVAAKFSGFGIEAQVVIDGRDLSEEPSKTLSLGNSVDFDTD
jgi:hypothetical protein